jgi:hypothetical protein
VVEVGANINTLIEKRAEQNGHVEQGREDLWASSVRAYRLRKQEDLRSAWAAFHTGQAERIEKTARELAAEHREKAEQLMTDEPRGAA